MGSHKGLLSWPAEGFVKLDGLAHDTRVEFSSRARKKIIQDKVEI